MLLLRAVPPTPNYCVISECRLSGVSNLLGIFPTIMALSVPVFSVSSICDRCLWNKKEKKENLAYCIEITILCAPRATAFGVVLHTPHGPPFPVVKVPTRVVV